jgi:hypothetical protein
VFIQDGTPFRGSGPFQQQQPASRTANQDPVELLSLTSSAPESKPANDPVGPKQKQPTPSQDPAPPPTPAPGQNLRAIPVLDEQQPLTVEDKQELERYGNRLRQRVGALLTPPAGSMSPEVKQARDYVRNLVQELAGDELEKAGLHVVVNLYSSEQINAFALKDPSLQQPGLLRRLAGEAVDGRPIYEVGVNLGTLRHFEYKEELAFILGHELTHILKGHTEEVAPEDNERLKRWVSSQAHEVVADAGGIEKMVRAGYDPEGALSALERLHQSDGTQQDNLVLQIFQALRAGASSHHHEGVRLSAAQAQVEHLRRTEAAALPGGGLTPLPQFDLGDPTRIPVPRKEFEKVAREVADMAEAMLDPKKRVARYGEFGSYYYLPPDGALDPELSWRNDNQLRSEVFMQAVRRLDRAGAAGQDKVDAALHLYEAMHTQWIGGLDLNEEHSRELLSFLTRHSAGAGGWKASGLLAGLKTEHEGKPVFMHADFAVDVLSSRAFQRIFPQLAERSPEWRALAEQVPEMMRMDKATGELAAGENFWRQIGAALDPWNQTSERKNSLVAGLERIASEPAEQSRAESWKFAQGLNRLLRDPGPGTESIRKALHPMTDRFCKWREHEVLQVLDGPPYSRQQEIGFTLAALEDSHGKFPVGEDLRTKLAPLLLGFARFANKEKDLVLGPYQPSLAFGAQPFLANLLVDLLVSPQTSAADRKELFRFLVDHLPHDSSASREGARAEPFRRLKGYLSGLSREEVLEMVATDRTAQSSRMLGRALALNPGMLGTAMLGRIARHKHLESDQIGVVAASRHREQNLRLSILGLLGYDRESSQQRAQEFKFSDLQSMTGSLADLRLRSQAMRTMEKASQGSHVGMDCAVFMMDILCASQREAPDAGAWYQAFSRIVDSNPLVLDGRSAYRDKLESYLLPHLESLPPTELQEWLLRPHVLGTLKAENAAGLLARLADGQPHRDIAPLAERVQALDGAFELQAKHPLIYQIFKEQLSEQARLQPGQLDQVFPPREGSLEQAAESHAGHLRGLSAMVAAVRSRQTEEQLHFLDYLLGRRDDMPLFVEELQRALEARLGGAAENVSLVEVVRNGRSQMSRAEPMARLLVTNSFLAGPSSILATEQGQGKLLDHLLAKVRPERQQLARNLAEVLLESHGRSESLAVAFVLSQSAPGGKGELDEAAILNSLFDAYGVPGIKFKQYLAFTSDFAEFRSAFESSQDAAMPLNYYQCIRLLEKRFDGQWPQALEVEKLLGSGSVNLALSYEDKTTGETGVASVARESVDVASEYDFQRLDRLLGLLTRTPEQEEKYGFLKGLAQVIRKSVTLEFDKDAAFGMQQQVQPLYNRQVNGWNVRTVEAFSQEHQTIFMQKAPGQTARKVLQSDPHTYRSAMGALAQVEMDVLLGVDASGSARPVPLHANPDFHDGQVLIDPETRTVTLLDFGQAVPLSNAERDYGLELLEILGGAVAAEKGAQRLNQRAPQGAEPLRPEELTALLERGEPMDAFVRLLGLMERKGNPVPLGTVHWVLAVNRQRALGVKIGKPVDRALKGLVLTRRLGGSLESYNRVRQAGRQLQQLAGSLIPGPLGRQFGLAS